MRIIFIITVFISLSYCDYNNPNEFKIRTYSKENYIQPNGFPNINRNSKVRHGKMNEMKNPFGLEPDNGERSICPTTNSAENSLYIPLLARRLINLLLSKARFKDSEGNTVPLDSVSDPRYGELSMSIMLAANPSELETLKEFGMKKHNLTVRRIDELLTNLFSADPPPQQWNNGCKFWSWDDVWSAIHIKVDGVKVLHVGMVLCLLWVLKRIFIGKSSWTMLLCSVLVASTMMEAVRMLEEETIKQHSEQMRQGNIPEYCLGIDTRSWWESLFAGNTNNEEECQKYHMNKNSNPALKISYLKAVLSQLQLVLDVKINTFRKLLAGYEDQWFPSNWFYQALMCSTIGSVAIISIVIYCGGIISLPFFLTIKGNQKPVNLGSQVQSLPSADTNEVPIKPPPRRKNGNKRVVDEIDHPDESSLSSTVIFNIRSGNFHFRDQNSPRIEAVKEGGEMLDQEKNNCTLCGHDFITKKEELLKTEEKSNAHSEKDVSGVRNEKTEDNSGDKNCDTKTKSPELDVLAGGDMHTRVEKKVLN